MKISNGTGTNHHHCVEAGESFACPSRGSRRSHGDADPYRLRAGPSAGREHCAPLLGKTPTAAQAIIIPLFGSGLFKDVEIDDGSNVRSCVKHAHVH